MNQKKLMVTLAVACAVACTTAGGAGATTVTPAGAAVTATNVGSIRFVHPLATVTCDEFTGTGTVPGSPDNESPDGSVVASFAAPRFGSCSSLFFPVEVSTFGTWTMTFMRLSGGMVLTSLILPNEGALLRFERCLMTASWTSAVPIVGRWEQATGTTAVTLQQSPYKQTGASCPSAVPFIAITGTVRLSAEGGFRVS